MPSLPILAAALFAASPAPAAPPQTLFLDNCSACHQASGQGVKGAFPALAGDPFVQGDGVAMAQVVLNGRGGMPAFKTDLDDDVIAAILTYVRSSWGNKGKPVSAADVAAARAATNAAQVHRPMQAH